MPQWFCRFGVPLPQIANAVGLPQHDLGCIDKTIESKEYLPFKVTVLLKIHQRESDFYSVSFKS